MMIRMSKKEWIFITVLVLVIISALWYVLKFTSLLIAAVIVVIVLAYLLIEIATQ